MCGIVGYVGHRSAAPVLLDGLKRLEYRGYDSAGVAIQNGRGLEIRKLAGRVQALADSLATTPISGSGGIGHTRWATHGTPTLRNAHPHADCSATIALVHNGIIENAEALRVRLTEAGHEFRTDTDTEVLTHLIEESPGTALEDKVILHLTRAGSEGLTLNQVRDRFASRSRPSIHEARKTLNLLVEAGKVAQSAERYFIRPSVRPESDPGADGGVRG